MKTQPAKPATHTPLARVLGNALTRKELADCIMLDDVHYQFIVRAVNAHEELVDILKDALEVIGSWGEDGSPEWAKRAEEAIAKAEGRAE